MKILSIETSCDDTAITIMEAKGGIKNASFEILANTSNSQIAIHAQYGGVFPALAKREHIKNLPILLEKVLEESKLSKKKKPVDTIAVTYGPGLEPSLWTGVVFAKELAEKWKVPLIPVNHMEGHIVSVFAKSKGSFTIPKKIETPILSLLVSGGHTELILSKSWMNYKIVGQTLDDAVGEAYDKVARMMGLPYPGGPQISKLAEEARSASPDAFAQVLGSRGPLPPPDHSQKHTGSAKNSFQKNRFSFSLPRPMMYSKNFDFSFSGLKTAVLYLIRDLKKENPNILENEEIKRKIALEFENAVADVLVHKTIKAQEKYKAKTIIIAGGVSCNEHIRRQMEKTIDKKTTLLFPEKALTGDNSIMIGVAGYLNYVKSKGKVKKASQIKATGNLRLK